jgi:hypothetical protein
VRGWGPEGGAALTYRVEGKAGGSGVDFLVSSTYSPGDGSQPQVISSAVCKQRLAALADEMSKRGIHGVATHPDRCRATGRDGVVTAQAPAQSPAARLENGL